MDGASARLAGGGGLVELGKGKAGEKGAGGGFFRVVDGGGEGALESGAGVGDAVQLAVGEAEGMPPGALRGTLAAGGLKQGKGGEGLGLVEEAGAREEIGLGGVGRGEGELGEALGEGGLDFSDGFRGEGLRICLKRGQGGGEAAKREGADGDAGGEGLTGLVGWPEGVGSGPGEGIGVEGEASGSKVSGGDGGGAVQLAEAVGGRAAEKEF